MTTIQILVLISAVALICYVWGRRDGKITRDKEFLNILCSPGLGPDQEKKVFITGLHGDVYEVRTKFLHYVTVLRPPFQHPFGGECHHD